MIYQPKSLESNCNQLIKVFKFQRTPTSSSLSGCFLRRPTNTSQSDTFQEPLSILGDYIDERKELYFQSEAEEGGNELKEADLDSCVSDQ